MKILYKAINRAAFAVGWKKLELWSYIKWLNWWMRRYPMSGYFKFVAEYFEEK